MHKVVIERGTPVEPYASQSVLPDEFQKIKFWELSRPRQVDKVEAMVIRLIDDRTIVFQWGQSWFSVQKGPNAQLILIEEHIQPRNFDFNILN